MSNPSRNTKEMIDEYLGKGYWEETTWPEVWDRNAELYPDKEAIVDSKARLTWSQAMRFINRLALCLVKLGIKQDEVLVLQLPNSVEVCLFRIACDKAGILCLPILTTLRHNEVDYILRYVGAVGIVIPREFRSSDHFQMVKEIRHKLPELRHVFVTGDKVPEGAISVEWMLSQPLEREYPADYLKERSYKSTEISWISHTTGSTGFPKFVQIPTCARMVLCKAYAAAWNLAGDDILAAVSPHTGGPNIIVYWSGAMVGAKVVMMERFEAQEALKLIERERVTALGFVHTLFTKMMAHPNRNKYDLIWYSIRKTMRSWPPAKIRRLCNLT